MSDTVGISNLMDISLIQHLISLIAHFIFILQVGHIVEPKAVEPPKNIQ